MPTGERARRDVRLGRLKRGLLWALSSLLLQACFDEVEEPRGDVDVFQDTSVSDASDIQLPPTCEDIGSLLDLCPVGSEASFSSELCEPGSSDEVQEVKGTAVGVCKEPSAGCSLLCELSAPCLCGLESLTADELRCQTCDAVCGNDICDFGEDPESCAFDCSGQCIPGTVRCFGDTIGTCDLRGFWDRQPCPNSGFCQKVGTEPPACTDCDESNPPVWLVDRDNDGFGDPDGATFTGCAPPSRFVIDGSDCDDEDPDVGGPTCVDASCEAGEVRCLGSERQSCDAEGDFSPAPCGACESGGEACRSPCLQRPPRQLCTSRTHSCVIRAGQVWCWGEEGSPALGTRAAQAAPGHVPAPVEGFADAQPVSVSCGVDFSCVVVETGEVWCWGDDALGQLGRGAVGSSEGDVPKPVINLEAALGVSSGERHTCANTAAGAVWCWGQHGASRLLNGSEETFESSATPLEALVDERTTSGALETPGEPFCDAAQVATGPAHTCVLRHDGRVVCWGQGRLAFGTNIDVQPYTVTALGVSCRDGLSESPAAETHCGVILATGAEHSCVLTEEEQVVCWGVNAEGQLGDGTTVDSSGSQDPPAVDLSSSGSNLPVALALGASHSCLLDRTGAVWCWGDDTSGSTPSATAMLTDAWQIAAVDNHTCALRVGGSVACWGQDDVGELGQAAPATLSTATEIPFPSD